ncbi:hypothetical protein [Candidatus Uabimicrobium sp. HlEnr_7]|uniref:hypothetical protein n=1 Tax=Candidatus Uabimicrobium helgolandensis TaxID=3095367 RepID=UPI003555DBAA
MFEEIIIEIISGMCFAVFTAFFVHLITAFKNKKKQVLVWRSLERSFTNTSSLLQNLCALKDLAEMSNKLCQYEHLFFQAVKKELNKEKLKEQEMEVIYRNKILLPYLEQNNFPLYNTIRHQLTSIRFQQKKISDLLLLSNYMPKELSILIQDLNYILRDFHDEFSEELEKLILCLENSKLLAGMFDNERKFLTEFEQVELPVQGANISKNTLEIIKKISNLVPQEYQNSSNLNFEDIQQKSDEELEYLKLWQRTLSKINPETLARAQVKSFS